jgi:hypothetical protein
VLHSSQPDYRETGTLLSAAPALLRDQVACSTPLIEECACHLSQTSTNWQAMQRWSINWQPRWSHPPGSNLQQVVPCSWQLTRDSVRHKLEGCQHPKRKRADGVMPPAVSRVYGRYECHTAEVAWSGD